VIREPINLATVLAQFDDLWSPRIVARVNDYDVRVAKVTGEHVWHAHAHTDEFFLVIDGELYIALRDETVDASRNERVVVLSRGALFVVPAGVEHRPFAPTGASILMLEPAGTSTVGDRHDPIPGHIDVSTGHAFT